MGAGKTRTISVSNASYSAIVASIDCSEIEIREDDSVVGAPTTGYRIKIPDTNATAVQRGHGMSFLFKRSRRILKDEIVGYIQAVDASTTFSVVERPI